MKNDPKIEAIAIIIPFRYPIVLLSMFALSALMSNVVCFNFVVLFMPSTLETENANHVSEEHPFYSTTAKLTCDSTSFLLMQRLVLTLRIHENCPPRRFVSTTQLVIDMLS